MPNARANRNHLNRTKVITVVFCLVVLPALLLFLAMRPAIAASPKPYNELQFAPLPPLKLPPYEQFTLKNGMKVFLMENHELPLVEGILRYVNLLRHVAARQAQRHSNRPVPGGPRGLS